MTVFAAAVMVVNDHLLKAAFPGVVTGKLSDLACMVVGLPLLALALAIAVPKLGWSRVTGVALAATAVGFALVKTTGVGASLASQAWTVMAGTSLVRRDPSDLVALPALVVAWWVALRCTRAAHGGARPRRVVEVARTSAASLFVVFAVAATSAPAGPRIC